MSLNFTNIVAQINLNTKQTNTSYTLANKVLDINLALDKAISIIFKAGGTWQYDDSNHEDYPIITTDIVSGQRDYSFVTDEQGNLILDIYKVMRKNADGIFEEIFPRDVQSQQGTEDFYDGRNITGVPQYYDKTANGIFFDIPADYNSTGGLKIYINREGSYFTTSDTTKKPGFAGLYHEYLALRPSYMFAMRNGLKNVNILKNEMLEMEADMKKYYRNRAKDETVRITPEYFEYE